MEQITLRKFPYPYQAALTICSDIDGTKWDNFIAIQRFLNTNHSTEIGPGLALPIGNSFWMYDRPDLADSAFSYFENLEGKESDVAPLMRDFMRAGILDVMHSYGNFSAMGDFSRKLAAHAIESLLRHNLQLTVWTNHGGIESIQNIGALSWGKGDIPAHEGNGTARGLDCYHSDLLIDYGLRFYWDSEASLTGLVGQDAPVRFSEAYWRSPLYAGYKMKLKSLVKGYLSFADLLYFKFHKKHFVPWQPFTFQNQLLQIDQLRDGNLVFRFKRFGHGKLDWSDNLNFLLNDNVLRQLLKKQGYLILYIHLGDQKNKKNPRPLSNSTIRRLSHIAELYHTGQLWVQTTSRLLTYNLIHKYLKWSVSEHESSYHIVIKGLNRTIPEFELSLTDLEGLTFQVPENKEATVLFNNRPIACNHFADPVSHQRYVMIPISRIHWPLS